jgi:hypothetical protein
MSCAKERGLSVIFKYDHSIINELEENGGFDPDSITLRAILQSQLLCKYWNFLVSTERVSRVYLQTAYYMPRPLPLRLGHRQLRGAHLFEMEKLLNSY